MCENCDRNVNAKMETLFIWIANTTKVNATCLFLIPEWIKGLICSSKL
jgi:hypothetical protein